MSLEFKKIEVNSIQEMLPFYAMRHNMTCDSVFLESYVWKDYYNVRYAIWENKALLWLMENEGRCFSAMPLCREEDLPGAFAAIEEYFNEELGYPLVINLADEYANIIERFGHWKDTAVLLRGDAVQSLTMIFLQMWDVDMRGVEPYGKYLTKKADTLNEKLGYVIPYADSPFDHENVGEEVYFHILNHAKKYVHIMTPYLILDNEMLTTLIRAAKSGIEVIIIMPHIPDKWYAFAVAKTYYKELIEGGVQIYEYTPGFVHAKIFVSDDDTATVGSINLDFRSLYLHFENGVFIYDNPEVQKVEEDFQNTLAKCHKVTVTEVRNRGILMKTAGQGLRLVAPLM